jgi:hypothetical protein
MLQIKQGLGAMPELGVLPPGQQTPTRLHALRLRQLQDLCLAYGLEPPASATTKDKLLVYMIQEEERGVFKGTPVSEYYLLHAQLNSDANLSYVEREQLEVRLVSAHHKEFPQENVKHNLYFRLQQQCKSLGLNSMGKSVQQMRKMIEEANKDEEPEGNPGAA